MNRLEQLANGVLAINLDERADRWQAFLHEVEPFFDTDRIHRLSAVKGTALEGFGLAPLFKGRNRDRTWAGRAGCALSHRRAITVAAQAKWRSVLILEDDIQFANGFAQAEPALVHALAEQPWDICYLGYTDPIEPFRKISGLTATHDLYQVFGCNTCHAYLIRETAYEWLLGNMPTQENVWIWLTRHRAIDRWYARQLSRHFKVLLVSPSVVNQRPGISDITGRSLEDGHVTEVLPGILSTLPFGFASGLRRAAFSVSGGYDSLRGLIKRRRGF